MIPERLVLIIDDDADIREALAEALEDEGYRVAGASNGLEALKLLRDEKLRPELIVLDVMMPVMDGWAFRAEQRKDPELAQIPVLVFTAFGSPPDVVRRFQAAGFLRKPVRVDELLATLDHVHQAQRPQGV